MSKLIAIISIVFIFFKSDYSFGSDSLNLKYKRAIDYILKSSELKSKIKRCYGKKALKFKVSNTLVQNSHWSHFETDLLKYDSLNFYVNNIDSVINYKPKKGEVRYLKNLEDLSIKKDSQYTLYFSEPYKQYLKVIIQEVSQKDAGEEFDSDFAHIPPIGGSGFPIILFLFDEKDNVVRVFIKTPIYD